MLFNGQNQTDPLIQKCLFRNELFLRATPVLEHGDAMLKSRLSRELKSKGGLEGKWENR